MGKSAAVPAGESFGRLVTVPLTSTCNNNCVFCPLGDSSQDGRRLAGHAVDRLPSEGEIDSSDLVCLVGGEPSLSADLPGLIAQVTALGPKGVLLQTNGRRLAYPKYLHALIEAGLTSLDISLHGPRADVHEYHSRAPGSFRQTVSALRAAAKSSLEVGVTTVVTRSNYRHLTEMVRLLSYIGVDAFHLSIARTIGTAAELSASVIPRLILAAPHVRAAAALGGRLGIFVAVSGLPLCLAGRTRILERNDREGTMGPDCEMCAARRLCRGLDPAYAKRHGFGELSPMKEPVVPNSSCEDDIRSLRFAGMCSGASSASAKGPA